MAAVSARRRDGGSAERTVRPADRITAACNLRSLAAELPLAEGKPAG